MAKKILIVHAEDGVRRAMVKTLKRTGAETVCVDNDPNELRRELKSGSFTDILFFVYGFELEKELIKEISSDYPDIGLFAAGFLPDKVIAESYTRIGAKEYIPMPALPQRIADIIYSVPPVTIGEKLIDLGFPEKLSGFRYLCTAAELCIADPSLLGDLTEGLYERVAELHNTTASLVERSMRNLSAIACNKGAVLRLTEGQISDRITNGELICAVCDMMTNTNF